MKRESQKNAFLSYEESPHGKPLTLTATTVKAISIVDLQSRSVAVMTFTMTRENVGGGEDGGM